MKSRIKSDSTRLLMAMMERGMNYTSAAEAAKIHRDTLRRISKQDNPVSLATAAKLRDTFGGDVIKIDEPSPQM